MCIRDRAWLERSIAEQDGIEVRVGPSSRLFDDLGEAERAELPRHRGELLMRLHGPGCYTSVAAMKCWNRRNERLAQLQLVAVTPEVGPEHIAFGPDGKLYTAMLSGAVLRMNADGSSIVIFEKADDYETDPDGGAGKPIGCGKVVTKP